VWEKGVLEKVLDEFLEGRVTQKLVKGRRLIWRGGKKYQGEEHPPQEGIQGPANKEK